MKEWGRIHCNIEVVCINETMRSMSMCFWGCVHQWKNNERVNVLLRLHVCIHERIRIESMYHWGCVHQWKNKERVNVLLRLCAFMKKYGLSLCTIEVVCINERIRSESTCYWGCVHQLKNREWVNIQLRLCASMKEWVVHEVMWINRYQKMSVPVLDPGVWASGQYSSTRC